MRCDFGVERIKIRENTLMPPWTPSLPRQMMCATPIVGAVMDIVVWLRSLGLGKYEAAFRENEIDETVLPSLTHENLKELGVTALGHRLSFSMPSLHCVLIRARRPISRGSARAAISCGANCTRRKKPSVSAAISQ